MANVSENLAGINYDVPDDDIGRHHAAEAVYTTVEHALETADALRRVWRQGLVPQLSTAGLEGLQRALEQDSPRLMTGGTMFPPPLQCCSDASVERCCPLSYACLDGHRPQAASVELLERRFAEVCMEASDRCGEPVAVRYFLNFVDLEPWALVRAELLSEVNRALLQRQRVHQAAPVNPLAQLAGESLRLAQLVEGQP
jgi:hypothetical protein